LHLDLNEVVAWIRDRKCSETGERLVEELRTDDGSAPAFAVGFVSVLAGTFLAAELLKTLSGYAGPLNDELNRAVFQFQNPSAASNRVQHYPRDNRCTACEPHNAAAKIWKQRFEQFTKYSAGLSRSET
jgi:hypothetical protein